MIAAVLALVLSGAGPVNVAASADALQDPYANLTVEQVAKRATDFRPAQAPDLQGTVLQPRTYWLRLIPQRNDPDEVWALLIHSDVGRADLYVPRRSGGFEHVAGGYDVVHDDAFVHRVLIVPNDAFGTTVYLRVVSAGPSDGVVAVPVGAGIHNILVRNTEHVFFIGYFVAIAGLYLVLYAILRQRPLIQYSAIMASQIALLYVDSGSAYEHLPAMTLVQRQILHDVLIYGYFTLLALFTTTFLRLLQRDRPAFALIAVTAAANVLGLVADFIPIPGWLDALQDPVTIAFFVALFVAGVRAWMAGMRPAIFYTLAIFTVLLGYAMNSLVSTFPGYANLPGFLIYGFDTAIALEALMLGIAVTERIRETAREYERLLVASHELENMALNDALTGTLNRRAFDRALADAWHTGAARREQLGLLMVDVDFFKKYNDRYGHQAGDRCLRSVAQACAGCMRGGELFARYGGEEFAAIVPNATMENLEAIAGRMRTAVEGLAIEHDASPVGCVTISIGGAAKHASDVRSEQGLVALADAALYRAKEQGRNRAAFEGLATPVSS